MILPMKKVWRAMIALTRVNGDPLFLNPDLIKQVDPGHDTVIALTSGEKVVVQERAEQILERIVEFRQRVLAGLGPSTLLAALSAGELWLHREVGPANTDN
jgi:flagellar protein FlbD